MNGLPYYKRYPRDFIEGTIGMPYELKVTYSFILDLIYMQGGSLPDDPRYIAGLLGVSVRKWNSLRDGLVATGKISVSGDYLTNYRAVSELEILSKYQSQQSENRRGTNKNKALAKRRSNHTDTEPDIEDKSSIPRKRGTRLEEDWILPEEWLAWAVSEGWPETTAKAEALKFKDYWIAKSGRDASKQNWQATWRNWMRNSKTPKTTKMAGSNAAKPTADNPTVKAIKEGKSHLLQSTSATFARQAIELGLVTVEECRKVGVI